MVRVPSSTNMLLPIGRTESTSVVNFAPGNFSKKAVKTAWISAWALINGAFFIDEFGIFRKQLDELIHFACIKCLTKLAVLPSAAATISSPAAELEWFAERKLRGSAKRDPHIPTALISDPRELIPKLVFHIFHFKLRVSVVSEFISHDPVDRLYPGIVEVGFRIQVCIYQP